MSNSDSAASNSRSVAQIVAAKKRLRAEGRALRAALSETERAAASAQICTHLCQLFEDFYIEKPVASVAVYLAMPHEANLDEFIDWLLARRVPVFAPRGDDFAPLEGLNAVREGRFGLREPIECGVWVAECGIYHSALDTPHSALILVPGLLFDRRGGRLGFGGGWYDRALACFPQAHKIGVAFAQQIVDEVPREAHDVLMDAIVTPRGVLSAARPNFIPLPSSLKI